MLLRELIALPIYEGRQSTMIIINYKNINIKSASNNAGVFLGQNFQIWQSFSKTNTGISGKTTNSTSIVIDNDCIDSIAVPINHKNTNNGWDNVDDINGIDSYNGTDGSVHIDGDTMTQSTSGSSNSPSSNHTSTNSKTNMVSGHPNMGFSSQTPNNLFRHTKTNMKSSKALRHNDEHEGHDDNWWT